MSDFILLLDRHQCPACRRKSAPSGYGQCRNCGMMLFDATNDFKQYEVNTGWREYWVFDRMHGWRHRSHVMESNSSPLHRVYSSPRLDSDYGTTEYNKRQLENSPERAELKREYKRLKKKPVSVRVS